MSKNILIEKPCHEDWYKMTPKGQGKHCDLCNKVVVDFTNAKEEEILNYIRRNSGQRVCGYFKSDQVVRKESYAARRLNSFRLFIDSKFTFPVLKNFLNFIVGVLLIMVGCQSRTTGEVELQNDIKDSSGTLLQSISPDTLAKSDSPPVMGKPVLAEDTIKAKLSDGKKKNCSVLAIGKLKGPNLTMDDVAEEAGNIKLK